MEQSDFSHQAVPPLISIIIPVYNAGRYLAGCLDSILRQTHKNMEVICVNDGSTDCSQDILDAYAQKDGRIKVIVQDNNGMSAARNAGLACASGPFVSFVDADDTIEPDTYQCSLSFFRKDIDLVVFAANVLNDDVGEDQLSVKGGKLYHAVKYKGKKKLNNKLLIQMTSTVWNKIFRKSIIDAYGIRFPRGICFEDSAFLYAYASHCRNAFFIDQYFYNYIQHSASIMNKMYKKEGPMKVDRLKAVEYVYAHFKKYGLANRYKALLTHLFGLFLSFDYEYSRDELKQNVLEYATEMAFRFESIDFDYGLIEPLREKKYCHVFYLNIPVFRAGCESWGLEYKPPRIFIRIFGMTLIINVKYGLLLMNRLKINGGKERYDSCAICPEKKEQ